MNKSMLSGHPCRIPHLTGIESEREPFRLNLAERLERKILIQFRREAGIPNLEAVKRMNS